MAAKSIAERLGVGKVRHLDVRWLWLQQEVRRGVIELEKVKGTENIADVGTKPLSVSEMRSLLARANVEICGG